MTEKTYESSNLVLNQILSISQICIHSNSFLVRDLEHQIIKIITQHNYQSIPNKQLTALANDLHSLYSTLSEGIDQASPQEALRVRTHQLAIAKMLVFTYGKSDFRLAVAHFHQGKAYLLCKSYEQAVNHLTIASTKISKMSDIKETKIYNSFILTILGACYYQTQRYDYALEVLLRAYDIQNSSQIQKNNFVTKVTLDILARTYLKQRLSQDVGLRKQKQEMKVKYQEEAVHLIDRLVDVLTTQFGQFENAYTKVLNLAEHYYQNKHIDSEDNIKPALEKAQGKKRGEQAQLTKLIEFLEDRVEYLAIDFDRNPLRQAIRRVKGEQNHKAVILELLGDKLRELLLSLAESVKKERIFKFKLLLSCALVTNSTDQQLKLFMKQYEERESQSTTFKKLTQEQRIEIYKLLLSYALKFSDNESQLFYLKKLDQLYTQYAEIPNSQVQLLNVKRSLSKLYTEMHMSTEVASVLEQIKSLQLKLYGPTSNPVKKTQSMLKLVKKQNQAEEAKRRGSNQRFRKTVTVSNHVPSVLAAR